MHHLEKAIVVGRISPLFVIDLAALADCIRGVSLIIIAKTVARVAGYETKEASVNQLLIGECQRIEW